MSDTVMEPPRRRSSSTVETTSSIWQDAEIRFDLSSGALKLRRGEHEIDTINAVEDTKGNNGDRGVMIVTNLRVMWVTAKNKSRANLSIGWKCVQDINIKMVNSKLRGDTQAVFIMTKYAGQRFEFIFTSLVYYSPRIFTTIQSVYKAYDTSRLYRELTLRASIVRDQELVLLPGEKMYEKIAGVWNLSTDQGNLGTMVITNVRAVWYAALAESFNVSMPYIQIRSVSLKNSKFGKALVVNTFRGAGAYVLGFRLDPIEQLKRMHQQLEKIHQLFAESPIFGVEVSIEKPIGGQSANHGGAGQLLATPAPLQRFEEDVEIDEEVGFEKLLDRVGSAPEQESDPSMLYHPDGELDGYR
ncbi:Bardet-Biedl syndrome 5 protein, putative [Perkinsus marinus ATCC 50983]|uniref:Bardet-Biedl syndrome 5 protein, putative n=1 Tax=Perkinsus marinus (strain ATCC 50983 / TXsc) TaxID=423536 RepID=C5LN48_PERM5|nr:Bardet-Biedl syndrome 5 protein, putative [Perkinsus marinus ATCC 50983]EER01847.1 Bardet-Biedl syndrome 5 protein, putative [Perkinsus marinus ATCC 50983]|eukprot:XP_002769129.1 Bardet-Biedl syndrome 5 protein, putative [Perkinsus marinus ATCC 50983]